MEYATENYFVSWKMYGYNGTVSYILVEKVLKNKAGDPLQHILKKYIIYKS